MQPQPRRALRKRLIDAYWVLVGMVGLGRPIVDRRAMYGDDSTNDPYSPDFDPNRRRR